ncbi:hypothetical protein LT330_001893 [Penicillium expansum]|nr:hypothetical protein LT330_001893 [Penicillium expansum]
MSETLIPHTSHNSSSNKSTILLVHGGFSDGQEWDAVWPLLVAYHVLIPDLPTHGRSLETKPLEINDAARRLASLIEAKAQKRIAHVVAISIGAHIAAAMAAQYPERVQTLIVSGFNLFAPNLISPILPYLVYAAQRTSGRSGYGPPPEEAPKKKKRNRISDGTSVTMELMCQDTGQIREMASAAATNEANGPPTSLGSSVTGEDISSSGSAPGWLSPASPYSPVAVPYPVAEPSPTSPPAEDS